MKGRISKDGKWKNLGGDLRMYIPSKSIYAVKNFRYLGIKPLFHCFGPISEREARRLLPGTIEAWKEDQQKEQRQETIADVIPRFLKYNTPINRRKRTVENHVSIFAELDHYFGDIRLADFDREIYFDRLDYVKKDKERIAEERKRERKGGVPRKTFNYLAVHMNMLMRYCYEKRLTTHLIKIPLTDEKKRVGRAIDHETAQRLFSHMSEEGKDMFALAYGSCMRRNEALLLTWDRFDLATGQITLRPEDVKTGSKTKRGRSIFVSDTTLARFRKRFERQKHLESPWVFPSPADPMRPQQTIKTAWKNAKRRAGITGRLRWHDLRHSGISYLINECGQNIAKVSDYVGTSVRILQSVYIHTKPEHTREIGQAIRLE